MDNKQVSFELLDCQTQAATAKLHARECLEHLRLSGGHPEAIAQATLALHNLEAAGFRLGEARAWVKEPTVPQ